MAFDFAPRLTPEERDRARGKLGKMRAEALAAILAHLTRQAVEAGPAASPFRYEAEFRAMIRAGLVLQGWRWTPADDAAVLVVTISLEILQAKRPSWEEGQRNYATGDQIARTRCANCHAPLEPHQLVYCSKRCAVAAANRRSWSAHGEIYQMRKRMKARAQA